jgi:TNF(Tumour Necrosis Factor) family
VNSLVHFLYSNQKYWLGARVRIATKEAHIHWATLYGVFIYRGRLSIAIANTISPKCGVFVALAKISANDNSKEIYPYKMWKTADWALRSQLFHHNAEKGQIVVAKHGFYFIYAQVCLQPLYIYVKKTVDAFGRTIADWPTAANVGRPYLCLHACMAWQCMHRI